MKSIGLKRKAASDRKENDFGELLNSFTSGSSVDIIVETLDTDPILLTAKIFTTKAFQKFPWARMTDVRGCALHKAAAMGIIELMRVLIDGRAELNVTDDAVRTPLIIAAGNGHLPVMQLLIESSASSDPSHRANLDHQDMFGNSALMWACERAQLELAKILIGAGASIDLQDKIGSTTLMLACEAAAGPEEREKLSELIALMVTSGADVNRQNDDGNCPLIVACAKGWQDSAKLMIAAGANLDLQENKCKLTPLLMALDQGHTELAKLLITAGANLNLRGNLRSKSDFSDDREGYTALMLACAEGFEELAKLMITEGADLDLQDEGNETALLITLQTCPSFRLEEAIAESLIDAGANVNTQGWDGCTALMRACSHRREKLALRLIEAGTDLNLIHDLLVVAKAMAERMSLEAINLPDKDGHTAIELWGYTGYGWDWLELGDEDGEEKAALVAHIEGLFSDLK